VIERGTKVICIKDDDWPAWARAVMEQFPVKGRIYTIREIYNGQTTDEIIKDPTGKNPFNFKGTLIPAILLEELKNPIPMGKTLEAAFSILRFAPLLDQPKEEVKEKIGNPIKTTKPKKTKIKKPELVPA